MLRTEHVPFLQSRAAWQLMLSTFGCMGLGVVLCYVPGLNATLGLTQLPGGYYAIVTGIVTAYCLLVQAFKLVYIRVHGQWL